MLNTRSAVENVENSTSHNATPHPSMTPPTIIVDTREQTPLQFTRLASEVGTLTTGDYSIKGMESAFAVERKSVADLIGSLSTERDRFMREIDRLRGFDFARLLIVGSRREVEQGTYRSRMSPKAAVASLLAIEARGVPIAWTETPVRAARMVEEWAVYFVRERAKPFATAAELKELVGVLDGVGVG